MRICDLTTLYIEGGAGGVNTYLREKARFFAAQGGAIEHIAVVPGERSEQRKLFGSTLHVIRSPRLPWNPQHRVIVNMPEVRRILRAAAPDVVEVDCAYILGRVARRELGESALIVGFYHVHLPFLFARLGLRRFSPFSKAAERFAWSYLDYCSKPLSRLFVPSLDMFERLRARGVDRLEHVPLGVNLELFRPEQEPRPRLSPRARTVLYVGRLSEEKDVRVLFEAYRLLAAKKRDVRLVVVGDGPLRPLAEKLAASRDDVSVGGLCPYGPELARLYSQADVLAAPGRNETFGLALLEALASGLPVVAARRGGPRELITPAVGALARPGNAVDLADKLSRVLARRPDPLRCRRHAERHYSWGRTFSRLLEIYENAGASQRGTAAIERTRQASRPLALREAACGPVPSLPTGGVS